MQQHLEPFFLYLQQVFNKCFLYMGEDDNKKQFNFPISMHVTTKYITGKKPHSIMHAQCERFIKKNTKSNTPLGMLIVWFAIYAAIYRNLYFRKYVAANMLSDPPNSAYHTESPFQEVGFGQPPVSKDEYLIQAANPLSTKTHPIQNHFRANLNTFPEDVL